MIKAILICSLYIGICISLLQNWFILTVVGVALFTVRYNSAALIPIAVLIDGYFGAFENVPLLTIASIAWFVAIEYLRPRLASTDVSYD